MFDVGMWELMMIGLVALIVLGPEKLPRAARVAGYWVRRARQSWQGVRTEIERELAADEFKRSIRDSQQALTDSASRVRETGAEIQRAVQDATTASSPQASDAKPSQAAPESATHSAADAAINVDKPAA